VLIHAANAWAAISVAAAEHGNSGRRLAHRASLGGLLTALVLAAIIAAFFSPAADLALFSLASLVVAVAVIELDLGAALAVCLAAGALSLAYPGLAGAYPFLLFFGPYPLIKALCDRHFGRRLSFLCTIAAGNVLAVLAALLFAWPLAEGFQARLGGFFWPLLVVLLEIVLILYDYALGLLIRLYMTRLRR
jgi:hypothetical protein